MSSPYEGGDKVTTANGSGTKNLNIGSSTFNCKDKILHVKNLLHIPSTLKNLLSVQKFSKDNNVSFEFDMSKVLVKDKNTHEVLMKGGTKNGLYTLHHLGGSIPHHVFLCEGATLNK